MRISTASLGLAAVLAAPVITTAASAAAGRDLSPEQSQVLFQARKTWAKDNYKLRLELLQSQQRCIDAAASADALKTCRRQMKKTPEVPQAGLPGVRQQSLESTGAPGAHRQQARCQGPEVPGLSR